MSVLDKLLKNTTIEQSNTLEDSEFFVPEDFIQTQVPMVNVALSGRLDGGLTSGTTMFAGPSKNFKTAFAMLLLRAFLDKYPEGACLFYDSEFGAPLAYFESFGIDKKRVIHVPVTDIEQLKFDLMKQLNELTEDDKVLIVIDSIGNLASKKEVEDALEQKAVADMTRAKQLKSLFRMVTPHLNIKSIPMVVVNHTYLELASHPRTIVGGGTGSYYSADNIFIIGRQQDKNEATKEIEGYDFIINVEKSRFVREKSKIAVSVSFEHGISTWSGLMDVALESGHVINPKQGWYQRKGEEKNLRLKDTNTREFWEPILQDKVFQKFVEDKYQVAQGSILQNLGDENE